MREVVGHSEIQPILTGARQTVEVAVQDLMQRTLDHYGAGVQVTQVQLQKVDPPAQVLDSFRDVQAARSDAERAQNEAQTYANRVVPEGRGRAAQITQAAEAYREQTVAEATGQASRRLEGTDETQSRRRRTGPAPARGAADRLRQPVHDLSEGFSHFVTPVAAPVASGWSGCRVGLTPTGKRRLVTAHTRYRHLMNFLLTPDRRGESFVMVVFRLCQIGLWGSKHRSFWACATIVFRM
jgi:SPFH domain / Band 7 family